MLLVVVFILAAGQLCHFGLPWWGLAPVSAVAGWLFPQSAGRSFLAGFIAGFLLWAVTALFLDVPNEGILSTRIGALFMGISRGNVLLATGLQGGLVAGLGCLSGRLGRVAFGKE
ncbi:MAG: hypothetical protein IPM98_19815 [Lewinellaceae bacterium]|nr:hypothetical protein [Lewinellaceae bacterium]